MAIRITAAKTRVYADEPVIFIITGLSDTGTKADYFDLNQYRYQPDSQYADSSGYREISDSPAFAYDANDIEQYYSNLPTTWNMAQVSDALMRDESWKVLAIDMSKGMFAVYRRPYGSRYPKWKIWVDDRLKGEVAAVQIDVIQQNMPESLRAQYLPPNTPAPPVIEEPDEELPPITIPPSNDGTYNPPAGDNTVPTIPELPPISQPPSSTLPAISAGTAIAGAGIAYLLFTKSGKKMLRRFKL